MIKMSPVRVPTIQGIQFHRHFQNVFIGFCQVNEQSEDHEINTIITLSVIYTQVCSCECDDHVHA